MKLNALPFGNGKIESISQSDIAMQENEIYHGLKLNAYLPAGPSDRKSTSTPIAVL
jgi:hypothetical protein